MQQCIRPAAVSGEVMAPPSKSAAQRALALALLHQGTTIINGLGASDDEKAALKIIGQLGADVVQNGAETTIVSKGINPKTNIINCGESGLSVRMFTPIAALSNEDLTIIGDGTLMQRPMHFFEEILPQLDVRIKSASGYLPMHIQGPLQANNISIDGSLSSQFLTGLLMAFGASANSSCEIFVDNLKSKPYIGLTLQMMNLFGYEVVNENYQRFIIKPKKNTAATINYDVEGDWSGAAFLLVAGAIAGNVVVTGLNVFSEQADKAVLQALMQAGAGLSITEERIIVRTNALQAFHFDATDCPDLFPPLAVLAAFCNGTSVIEGVNRLMHKESNRALTLQEEFGRLGIEIKVQDDLMIIAGGQSTKSGEVQSHHDHRIAMALAILALKAEKEIIINNSEAVSKSYPGFFDDLKSITKQAAG